MTISKILLFSLSLMAWSQNVIAHGGVGMEDDKCVINIGFLQAHFIGYQQTDDGSQEFCEDIPEVANSIFVIDYQHDYLKEMLVDFRILKDVNEIGKFAQWDDVAAIENIEQQTIFYLPATIHADGALKANYDFKQAGGYIGVVTAMHPKKKETYRAVFYFHVGAFDYGYIPVFIALLILAQLIFWRMGPAFILRTARKIKNGTKK
ncbi:MAG: hypothetical protein QNK15_10740 [Cycloclasticus sp.]|nr:hypothetical protein [Cycloclasticus sp.]